MTDTLIQIAVDFWHVVDEMAPYLLFGFLMAGLLSVFISPRFIERHLGSAGLVSILKAAAFGVPLPLCSCGVIPVSASLRRAGASKGATVAFLMATPQDGVDSVLVTLSLLGPVFAIFRPIVAVVSGAVGGGLVSLFDRDGADRSARPAENYDAEDPARSTGKLVGALKYGFVTLPADIGRAMLVGLVVAALISALVPKNYFADLLAPGWGQMFVMMLAGIPVYVCATASVPVAWALIGAGVSPGAALVFLMTGPATNAATLATVWRVMGKRTAVIYLLTVAAAALAGGALLDAIYARADVAPAPYAPWMLPHWVKSASAGVLLGVLAVAVLQPFFVSGKSRSAEAPNMIRIRIKGMTCSHCVQAVRRALLACQGVRQAQVDLHSGIASVEAPGVAFERLCEAVRKAGYEARDPDE